MFYALAPKTQLIATSIPLCTSLLFAVYHYFLSLWFINVSCRRKSEKVFLLRDIAECETLNKTPAAHKSVSHFELCTFSSWHCFLFAFYFHVFQTDLLPGTCRGELHNYVTRYSWNFFINWLTNFHVQSSKGAATCQATFPVQKLHNSWTFSITNSFSVTHLLSS